MKWAFGRFLFFIFGVFFISCLVGLVGLSLLFFLFFRVCVYVCVCDVCLCECMSHVCRCPRRPEEGVRSPDAELQAVVKCLTLDLETVARSPGKQEVLLTNE